MVTNTNQQELPSSVVDMEINYLLTDVKLVWVLAYLQPSLVLVGPMKPVYGPVPSLISFFISQLKIKSLTYAQYMTPYQSMKLDIVFLVPMAIMFALTGFSESNEDIAELCR